MGDVQGDIAKDMRARGLNPYGTHSAAPNAPERHVTDEMVDAAVGAFFSRRDWTTAPVSAMRAAIEAALS